MKKILFVLIFVSGITAVNAQRIFNSPGTTATKVNRTQVYSEATRSTPITSVKNQRRYIPHPNSAGANNCVAPPNDDIIMGQAGNAFGTAFGSRTNLWYDKDINTISFVHRNNGGGTNIGSIYYDYSTDMGATWTTNVGPVYLQANNVFGRYPQGAIYNPGNNTTPTNATIGVYGPITNATDWIDNYEGSSKIGSNTHAQQVWPTVRNSPPGYLWDLIPDGMQIVKNTGTMWVAAEGVSAGTTTTAPYDDSIFLAKGTFNGSDFSYDFKKTFPAPSSQVADVSTAWSDDGMTGYVVFLGNDEVPQIDSAYYPIVYKTTDGGISWRETTCRHANLDIDNLSLALGSTKYSMTTAFDVDCALDKNNNLHIAVGAGFYVPSSSSSGAGISTAPGNHGIFDIYTTDGGSTWYGELMDKPETFRGSFGITGSMTDPPVDEDNRPAVTRSWDGSKIFISWFDTDTINFPGVGNVSPDWHVRGYDINSQNTTNVWTAPMDMTDTLTSSYGFCTFGNLSYYSVTHGSDEWLPMVFVQLSSQTSTGSPVTFHYFDGGCVKANSYTVTGAPLLLDGSGLCVGINEYEKPSFTISANYPNPFTGATMVDVFLTKPFDVTIELSNMVGQVLSTKTYKNLNSGENHLTIEANDFATGLYLYKVKVGGEVVTRTMSVK